ncbi:MAG: response regulator, partial [Candidatus Saccharimonadales bacterium]
MTRTAGPASERNAMSDRSIKTILIEHREIARLGLRLILQSMEQMITLAEFGEGQAAIEEAQAIAPDLILMNIGLPASNGILTLSSLKQSTSAKIVVVTSHRSADEIFAALRAGADGYCLTGLTPAHLISVIHCVLGGGLWLDSA